MGSISLIYIPYQPLLVPNYDKTEEGGINALLALGKSRISGSAVQYKAALTVGRMAKNAAQQQEELQQHKSA